MEERQKVFQFCKEYGFDHFFAHLPQGLDTLAGEDGIKLSGGQQQLIALARALYRRPIILLLDEPTSAMDNKTEQFVMDLLHEHKSKFATFLVTHRRHLGDISHRAYVLQNDSISSAPTPNNAAHPPK